VELMECGEEDVDDTVRSPLVVPVNLRVLLKILEFCRWRSAVERMEQDATIRQKMLEEWINFDQALLFEIILAANTLGFQCLLDLTCRCVANMIKGKNPEEIRKTFNIKNDFTPEEEEKVRKENEWCDETWTPPQPPVPQPVTNPDPNLLQRLIDMDFSTEVASRALVATQNDFDAALDYILQQTPQQPVFIPLQTVSSPERVVPPAETRRADPEKVQQLLEMGFDREMVEVALLETNNDVSSAVQLLS